MGTPQPFDPGYDYEADKHICERLEGYFSASTGSEHPAICDEAAREIRRTRCAGNPKAVTQKWARQARSTTAKQCTAAPRASVWIRRRPTPPPYSAAAGFFTLTGGSVWLRRRVSSSSGMVIIRT